MQGEISLGKQINYYIEYDSFVLLAQKALDLGCKIIKEDLLKLINEQLTLGKISNIYFTDYIFIQ